MSQIGILSKTHIFNNHIFTVSALKWSQVRINQIYMRVYVYICKK